MRKLFIPAFLALAAGANFLHAQAPATRPGQPAGDVGSTAGDVNPSQLDASIAACLWLGNHEEIALAQFAKEHAKSDTVKEFAVMMIKDHEAALEKLQLAAPQLAKMSLEVKARPEGDSASVADGARGLPPMIAMEKRIAEECLSLTLKELGEHEGASFDRCYIGQQIGAHVAMLAKLRGSKNFASTQLRPFIEEATKAVEKHHGEAKKLAKTLESEDQSTKQAGRPDTDSRK